MRDQPPDWPADMRLNAAGVVLAGGRARRMGSDKSLVTLAGQPLVSLVVERLRPQVKELVISANGDPRRFSFLGIDVVTDSIGGFAGPLAGILTGLQWARNRGFSHMISVATDTPFFPQDLVMRLRDTGDGDAIHVARSGGRPHPVFSLWPVSAIDLVLAFLQSGENASVLRLIETRPHRYVDFALLDTGGGKIDPFFNINTPDDLDTAERIMAGFQP
jgi:molybdopterin-guanine dinucleotide biosynthesis protein A